MGILESVLGAPLAPLRGTVWVAEKVQGEAERQYYDPGVIRRRLEDVSEARREGTIDEAEAAAQERELVLRLRQSMRRRR